MDQRLKPLLRAWRPQRPPARTGEGDQTRMPTVATQPAHREPATAGFVAGRPWGAVSTAGSRRLMPQRTYRARAWWRLARRHGSFPRHLGGWAATLWPSSSRSLLRRRASPCPSIPGMLVGVACS